MCRTTLSMCLTADQMSRKIKDLFQSHTRPVGVMMFYRDDVRVQYDKFCMYLYKSQTGWTINNNKEKFLTSYQSCQSSPCPNVIILAPRTQREMNEFMADETIRTLIEYTYLPESE